MWKLKENVANENASEVTKGLWNVYEDDEGQTTLKLHKPKLVWKSCQSFADHDFEWTGNRELTCKHCNFIFLPIIGIHSLVNGKIVEKAPPLPKK
jgi:hypothetical protein